jgi:hypothetical protein
MLSKMLRRISGTSCTNKVAACFDQHWVFLLLEISDKSLELQYYDSSRLGWEDNNTLCVPC